MAPITALATLTSQMPGCFVYRASPFCLLFQPEGWMKSFLFSPINHTDQWQRIKFRFFKKSLQMCLQRPTTQNIMHLELKYNWGRRQEKDHASIPTLHHNVPKSSKTENVRFWETTVIVDLAEKLHDDRAVTSTRGQRQKAS